MNQSIHKELLIKSFIASRKRVRMLSLLSNPKKRRTVLNDLYHFDALDDRFVVSIDPKDQSPGKIAEILRKHGSPDTCCVISTDDSLDSQEMLLAEALVAVVGHGEGSFVSCIPGELAFFEGEEPGDRCILRRIET